MENSLNPKQKEAVDHELGPLLIIAGAGTGKTTVITERIKHLIIDKEIPPSSILALTFTDKASFEMQERIDLLMPYGYTNLWIHTFHSFCDRILRDEAHSIGLDPNYKLITEAEAVLLLKQNIFELGLKIFRPLGNPTKFLDALLTHFSRLKDEDINPDEYIKFANSLKKVGPSQENELQKRSGLNANEMEQEQYLELSAAYKAYKNLKVKNSLMDFSDLISNTLLLFRTRPNILKKYQKQFQFILVDEFQDTNYAQNELAILLAGDDHNITVVADDDQCLPGNSKILTPKGDVPISQIKIGDEVITAVGKGHLSISKAMHVNKTKKHARMLTFITESGEKLEVTDNHKMFCMVPARKFGDKKNYFVYLMKRSDMGWRLGVTDDLAQRLKLERSADLIVGIKSYRSIEDALLNETILSMRYQIPKYPFKPRVGMKLTDEWLKQLFASFDTNTNALNLAEGEGIDLTAHHFCLGGVVRGKSKRVKINLNMCARRYSTVWAKNRLLSSLAVLHEVRLETSSESILRALKAANIQARPAKKGWIVRKMFSDLRRAGDFAKQLEKITDSIVEAGIYVGKRNNKSRKALILPAKNILEGMYIPVRKGYEVKYERVEKRKEEQRTGEVYDLEIEKTHNFIANNIVVHNSIYRFRGAAVSNVLQFKKNFPKTKVITLTDNYRSTQTILDCAYSLIQNNNPNRLEVVEKIDKKLKSHAKARAKPIELIHETRAEDEADAIARKIYDLKHKTYEYKDIAILVRANNHAQLVTTALQRHKIPYQFLGPGYLFQQEEVKDLIAYLMFLTNLTDSVSLFRVLSMDIFNIPYIELNYLLNFAKKKNLTLFEALESISQTFLKPDTVEKLGKIREMIKRHMEKSKKDSAGQILYYFIVASGLFETLANTESVKDERRTQNIAKFFDRIKTFESERPDSNIFTLTEWLTLMLTMGDSPTAADVDVRDLNAVNILTVHSSKGLEFKTVFLVNLVNDRFPSRERSEKIPLPERLIKENVNPEIDFHQQEERRLFYVGITRAKELLFFTGADFYGTGKRVKKLSPFIYEALPNLVKEEKTKEKIQQLSLTEVLSVYDPSKNSGQGENDKKVPYKVSYITYSNLQMFDICPLHYKAKVILGIPTPTAAVQSFGITMHITLQKFYEQIKEGGTPSLDELKEILKKSWISDGFDSKAYENERKRQGIKILEEFYKTECSPPVKPLALELPFNFTLKNGVKVFGKIDRIDSTPEGIEIIDYKTGEENPKAKKSHELQLAMYALAATRVRDDILNKKPEEITFKKEDLEKLEDELLETIKEIENSDFKCSRNILCLTCEYKLLCNAGV
jgi:DNA helicase II / ATP-dependent DNA helicase PcrA